VIEELRASRDLLTFTDDWDGQGALGYSEETWIRAARLLSELSSLVAQDRNAVLGEFEIQPGANGALNIDWNLGGLQLLIVVPAEPAKVAQFYGDDGKGERKVRGELGRPNEVQALAVWLRE